jgi:hypothetical protein
VINQWFSIDASFCLGTSCSVVWNQNKIKKCRKDAWNHAYTNSKASLFSFKRLEFDYRLPLPVVVSTPIFFIAIPKLSRVNNNEVVSMYNGMTVRDWLELAVGSRHMWVNLISLELQGALGEVLLAELLCCFCQTETRTGLALHMCTCNRNLGFVPCNGKRKILLAQKHNESQIFDVCLCFFYKALLPHKMTCSQLIGGRSRR